MSKINPIVKLIVLGAGGLYGGYAIHQLTQPRTDTEVERRTKIGQQYTDEQILAKWEAEKKTPSKSP